MAYTNKSNYYKPRRNSFSSHKRPNNNRRGDYKRRKKSPVLTTIAYILIIGAVLSLFANVIVPKFIETTPDNVTVYLVPSTDWASDSSNYGAWLWNNSGVPEGSFVLGTDSNEDGVIEFNVSTDYSRMLFVDLVPEATELGEDWKNKRDQTDNLAIPKDKNVYYHKDVNEWSTSKNPIYIVTTEEIPVQVAASLWDVKQNPVMYCFDKTCTTEPQFITMIQCGAHDYTANVPAGYTHIIFIDYEEGVTEGWDNILHQTPDLLIPNDNNNLYDTSLGSWTSRD